MDATTPPPYQVLPFSSANLFRHLGNDRCPPDDVARQDRAQYLYDYLSAIGARTVIVEFNYTDGDYLEDFASYYCRCFETYERRCKRLHFFSADISDTILRSLITGTLPVAERALLLDSYLGFVVARPLPSAIIGRTILKTYPPDGSRRHYTVVRSYEAHLFGTPLRVLSLPFQEQDSVLAACATVALWCAFHKTADLFGTTSPRPAAITRLATRVNHRGRSVPSHGLRIEAMCQAITDIGLEPELVDCVDQNVPLVSLVYAHLKMGLPVILVVEIENRGLHAITLTGYSLRDKRVLAQEVSPGNACIPMIGLRIDELYGHDDQIGPFARLTVGPSASTFPVLLKGSWIDKTTRKQLDLRPIAALIPIYNKVRVTFLDVQAWLTRLTGALTLVVPNPHTDLEWDLHLVELNDYKMQLPATSLPLTDKERLLTSLQPRFMWRAVLRISDVEVLELLADATDMARSFPIREAIWLHPGFKAAATAIITAPVMQASLVDTLTRRFLDLLKASL